MFLVRKGVHFYNDAGVSTEVMNRIVERVISTVEKASDLFCSSEDIVREVRVVKNIGKTTARAYVRSCKIEINSVSLKQDPTYMIENVIPHEVAHIVAENLGLGYGHDKGWKRVCIALGGNGSTRTTSKKIKAVKARRTRMYEYDISGEKVWLSSIRHKKTQNAKRAIYYYRGLGVIEPAYYTGKSKLK